jgi:hypothetical protein
MIIAENLPEDSSRNSLEKIFGVVGRSARHTNNIITTQTAHHTAWVSDTYSNACS